MSPTLSTTKSTTGLVNAMFAHLDLRGSERVEYRGIVSLSCRKRKHYGKRTPDSPIGVPGGPAGRYLHLLSCLLQPRKFSAIAPAAGFSEIEGSNSVDS